MKKISSIIFRLIILTSIISFTAYSQKTNENIKIKFTTANITETSAKILIESNKENVVLILSFVDKEQKISDQQISVAPSILDYSKLKKLNDNSFIIGKIEGNKLNLNINNLPSKSKFYLQGYNFDKNTYNLIARVEIQTLVTKPTKAASNLAFSNVTDKSMKLTWVNGNGEGRIVIASKGDKIDLPNSSDSYIASNKMGDEKAKLGNSYVIFDSKGKLSNCEVTNLTPGKYTFFVVEYNGDGPQRNYLTEKNQTNPRMKSTAIPAPKALPASEITESSFIANWSSVEGAQSYILQVATDDNFKNILEMYNSLDIGQITNMEVIELEKGNTYYYRVQAKGSEGVSGFSNTVKVNL